MLPKGILITTLKKNYFAFVTDSQLDISGLREFQSVIDGELMVVTGDYGAGPGVDGDAFLSNVSHPV